MLILVLATATTGCACPACPALEEGVGRIKAHVVGVLARAQRQVTRRKRHAAGDEVVVDEDGVVVLLLLLLLCVVAAVPGESDMQGCISPWSAATFYCVHVCVCVGVFEYIKSNRRYVAR